MDAGNVRDEPANVRNVRAFVRSWFAGTGTTQSPTAFIGRTKRAASQSFPIHGPATRCSPRLTRVDERKQQPQPQPTWTGCCVIYCSPLLYLPLLSYLTIAADWFVFLSQTNQQTIDRSNERARSSLPRCPLLTGKEREQKAANSEIATTENNNVRGWFGYH
jgi:hypothetical protein